MSTFLTKQSTRLEVSAASMTELVAFYNDVTGKTIKKFETRAVGVERCLKLLAAPTSALAAVAREITSGPTPRTAGGRPIVTAPAKKVAARKAAPKARPTATKPRIVKDPDTARITVLARENPKKFGAAERFALYRNGMTVSAYIAAGGQRRDVAWDVKMKFISVK